MASSTMFGVMFAILLVSTQALRCTVTKDAAYYLWLSDHQLFHEATGGSRVGRCYIGEAGKSAACDLYVKSAVRGKEGDLGWPKTSHLRGTGCVRAPDFPKRVTTCYYNDHRYVLSAADRKAFCTGSGKSNAAAQLRHAIRNKACSLGVALPIPCVKGTPKCTCY